MIESLAEPERLIGQVIGAGGGALELEKMVEIIKKVVKMEKRVVGL